MARSKRTRQPRRPKDDHKEQGYSEPDPNSDDYLHDDVDKFHAEREKILLDSTAYDKDGQGQLSDESEQDEEVMALNIDEFDDEDDDYFDDDDGSVAEDNGSAAENEELDEEEQESENEKDIEKSFPSQKSWGKKKSAFYDADIVEEYAGSDEEMDKLAEEEEEEALALQRQMAASLEEQDFDADQFELPQPTQKSDKEQDDLNKERIVQDLSKLSKAEKIQILMKDSPELLHLMDELKSKLKEVIEKLHPLVQMARAGQIPKEGANYLELKHQLYLNYCINIGFYFLLKAKKMSVRDHPVMERLVQYQKLITELKPLDEKLKPEVELLLLQSRVTEQDGSQEEFNFRSVRSKKTTKKPSKRPAKLSTLLDDDDDDDDDDDVEFGTRVKTPDSSVKDKEEQLKDKKKAKKRKRKGEGEPGAMDPLEYYEAVKLQKRKKKEAKEAAFRFTEQQEADKDDIEEGKRGITYEISQNKGLTAKKKKELRNPRVKHRKKFYKAKIKRKSQVLPVANEQNRYGGEMTGIRSHLTRSIKIK